jgi:colicin import membrane protein
MQSFIRENAQGLAISLAGHGMLFLIMGLNLVLMTTSPRTVQLAIEATVIDVGEINRQKEALERQKREVEQARRKRQEAERRKIEKERAVERQRKEEAKRKQDAERQRKAEDARVAEEQQKAEAERNRVEAEKKRRQEELESEFQRQLAEDEKRLVAIRSGKLAEYLALIADRVERNWVQPASATAGIECEVHVTQIPGGEVVSVRIGRCNGDKAVLRSIEAAVHNASPLPPPPDPSLFDKNLRFTFKPKE